MNQLPTLAGMAATILFIASTLPMVIKAIRTRDLPSYSGTNLLTANVANALQWIYLASVPAGPIWALHTLNTLASGLMLGLWLRHEKPNRKQARGNPTPSAQPCGAAT